MGGRVEDEEGLQVGQQVSQKAVPLADHGGPLGHLLHSEEPLPDRRVGVHVAGVAQLVGNGGQDGGGEFVFAERTLDGLDFPLYGDDLVEDIIFISSSFHLQGLRRQRVLKVL